MIPDLDINDMNMFYKYLNNINVYFEFGSGGSTYQASIRDNIKKIYTVESDITWLNKLKQNIKNNNIIYFFNDMDTKINNLGYPGVNSTIQQKINYSNHIVNLNYKEQQEIDLVFIDGRFRVACCLKCYDIIRDNTFIIFDDFINRPYYHIILYFYNIIEKTNDNRMVVLQKKKNMKIPIELIKKYELIPY